jgi:hypothetical protein
MLIKHLVSCVLLFSFLVSSEATYAQNQEKTTDPNVQTVGGNIKKARARALKTQATANLPIRSISVVSPKAVQEKHPEMTLKSTMPTHFLSKPVRRTPTQKAIVAAKSTERAKGFNSTALDVPSGVIFSIKNHDFGNVRMGENTTHLYEFTNMRTEPLEIDAISTCACTALEYSRNPILPGQNGFVRATFKTMQMPEAANQEVEKEINIVFKNRLSGTAYPLVETVTFKAFVGY